MTTAQQGHRSARRRAREFAVQGLYEWLVGRGDAAAIDVHLRELDGWGKADHAQLTALLHGAIDQAAAIDEVLARHTDRATKDLSPVEHAVLMAGVWELIHAPEVPYKVVINEAIELTKVFGGTDGHKFVNGVLDKAAGELRAVEVQARRAAGR